MMREKRQAYYRQSGLSTWQSRGVPEPGENRACPAWNTLPARPLAGSGGLASINVGNGYLGTLNSGVESFHVEAQFHV